MPTTPQPKSLALMFLLGAFLTGGAVGFAADRAVAGSRPANQFDYRTMRDSFAKELNLTADQRRVIDSAFDWRRARDREVKKQYQPALDSVRDSARVLIRAVLNPTQQTAFAAMIERSRVVSDSMSRTRGERK